MILDEHIISTFYMWLVSPKREKVCFFVLWPIMSKVRILSKVL